MSKETITNQISKLITKYLEHLSNRGRKERTIKNYRDSLLMMANHLQTKGIKRVEQVTKEHAASFVRYLNEVGYKPITRALIIGQVKRFFGYTVKQDLILKSPFHNEPMPRYTRGISRSFFTIDEIEKFFNKLEEETNQDIMYRSLFELLYGSGMRINEALHLTTDNIDYTIGYVKLEETKNSTSRTIPLPEITLSMLDFYGSEIRPEFAKQVTVETLKDRFFLKANGTRVTPINANKRLKKIAQKAGIEKEVSCHSFRYSYATHMLEAGIDIRKLAELMGHKCLDATANYTRVIVNKLREELYNTHPRGKLDKDQVSNIKYSGVDPDETKNQYPDS